MRNAHCKTWNKARKLKNMKNQTQTLTGNMVKETEKRGKCEMYTLCPGIWGEN